MHVRSRSTQAERSERTRGALLEAAAKGLSRYGYGNLLLEEVARDAEAAVAVLADDVVFHGPIAFRPYVGRAATGAVVAAVVRARVDGKDVLGRDLARHEAGRVVGLTVLVRPLPGAVDLRERVAAELARP